MRDANDTGESGLAVDTRQDPSLESNARCYGTFFELFSLREVQLLPSHSCFPPNPRRLLGHETERPTERSMLRRTGIELGFRRRYSNHLVTGSLIVTDSRTGDDGHICSFFGICFKRKLCMRTPARAHARANLPPQVVVLSKCLVQRKQTMGKGQMSKFASAHGALSTRGLGVNVTAAGCPARCVAVPTTPHSTTFAP